MFERNIFKISFIALMIAIFAMGATLLSVQAVQAATDCSLVTEIPQTECQSLLDLYNSTNGASWTINTGWNVDNTPCSWKGVACSGAHVTNLDLNTNQLSGAIPNLNLPNLTYLDLYNNQLSGAIPDFNLPNLTYLRLSTNQLSGAIPNFNLPKLAQLYLSYNMLSGAIPNFNLPNLTHLYLYTNQLSGAIPDFNLPNLTYLDLNTNKLSGTIPNFNMPNMTHLRLEDNQLSGTIPNFNMPNMTFLWLKNNQLSGTIPNFNMPNLTSLDLGGNQLSGTIPDFNLPNLTSLTLGGNQLSGTIPNFNMPKMTSLWLTDNQLTGTIPNFNMPNLTSLWLAANQLSGTIPNFNLPKMTSLNLASNQLSGTIPNLNFASMTTITLVSNCGLTAFDTAQATVLNSKDPNWQTLNPVCAGASNPTITAISPASGLTAGGTNVTITGTGFVAGSTSVKIGGVAATGVTVTNPTSLTCTTPAGTAGAKDVVVTVTGAAAAATLSSGFTYAPPTVSKLAVTGITNSINVGATSNVTVTAQDGSGITVTDYTGTIYFTSTDTGATFPASYTFIATDNGVHTFTGGVKFATAGSQTVTATDTTTATITGSQTVMVNFIPTPTISNVAPPSGMIAGGTTVTITGTNFIAGSTSVTIGGVAATGVTVTSPTSLTCTTPAGTAGAKDVEVTVTGAAAAATLSSGFTYMPCTTAASFTADSMSGYAPLTVQFNAAGSSSDVNTYSWDFGDSQTGTGIAPQYLFTKVGTFTVTLTVTGNCTVSSQKTIQVMVTDRPNKPVPLTPANNFTSISLTPTLTVDKNYVSPVNAALAKTRWQIASSNFTNIVYDVINSQNLFSIWIPDYILIPNTQYWWRVQFIDNQGISSDWSDVFTFTTVQSNPEDSNNNNMPDSQEVSTDASSLCAKSPKNGVVVCIKSSGVKPTGLKWISANTLPAAPSGVTFPADLFTFRAATSTAGDTITVTMTFSYALPANARCYKYNQISQWLDYANTVTISTDRKTVVMTLTDGATGDSDGIANGIIVDPVGFTYTANDSFAVLFQAGIGGTVSGAVSQMVGKGGNSTAVTAVPNAGYQFAGWTGTGGFTSMANPLIVTNVTGTMTIAANYTPYYYEPYYEPTVIPTPTPVPTPTPTPVPTPTPTPVPTPTPTPVPTPTPTPVPTPTPTPVPTPTPTPVPTPTPTPVPTPTPTPVPEPQPLVMDIPCLNKDGNYFKSKLKKYTPSDSEKGELNFSDSEIAFWEMTDWSNTDKSLPCGKWGGDGFNFAFPGKGIFEFHRDSNGPYVLGFYWKQNPPAAPVVPSDVKATAGDGQVTISWNSIIDADSYIVWYKFSGSDWMSTGEISDASKTITGLTNGTVYSFAVQAKNYIGTSRYSVEVSATPESK